MYKAWSSGKELGRRLSEGVRRSYDQANVTLQPWKQERAAGDVIVSEETSVFSPSYLSLYIIQSFLLFLWLPLLESHVYFLSFTFNLSFTCLVNYFCLICSVSLTRPLLPPPLFLFSVAERLIAVCFFYFHYSREDRQTKAETYQAERWTVMQVGCLKNKLKTLVTVSYFIRLSV